MGFPSLLGNYVYFGILLLNALSTYTCTHVIVDGISPTCGTCGVCLAATIKSIMKVTEWPT